MNHIKAIEKVIKHGQFINGPEVQEFEDKLAEYLNVKYVITCANGTDALQLAYMALNLKKVVMPSFNYVSSAEALKLLRGQIIFADVDYDTFHIEQTGCTEAVVYVGLFGLKCLPISNGIQIEDNAQCLGSTRGGLHLHGQVGTTSFFPTKNLCCMGDGGAVYTNYKTIADKVRALKNHGQAIAKYQYDMVGINSRLDTIQAAILIENLKKLDNKINSQRERAYKLCKQYDVPFNDEHTYNNFTIKVKDRSKYSNYRIYYPEPLHKQKPYFQHVYLPVTERLCKEVITL